jgi:predicted Na+-dependent transporter
MHIFFKRIGQLLESYVLIVFVSLFIGLVFSHQVAFLSEYGQAILAAICFLSALKLDLASIEASLKDVKALVIANTLMLILFPVGVYYLCQLVLPQFAIAFMLLAAMPTGMTSPLLSEVTGGRQGLALVLTASTSLLAPFTIPFVLHWLLGSTIAVNFGSMIWSLAKVMILPIVLAMVIRPLLIKPIKASLYAFKPVSLVLLGILITGIVAKQGDAIMDALHNGIFLWSLVLLCLLFIVFHLIGYFITPWKDRADRITMSICLTYMNFTLAIFIVGQYFEDPNIVIPVILSTIPWSLMVIPFSWAVKRVK